MSKHEHTPGPWAVGATTSRVGKPGERRKYSDTTTTVLIPAGEVPGGTAKVFAMNDGEREANARLIAAAPDLLAACEAMMRADMSSPSPAQVEEDWQMLRAAIAKARGQA